MRPRSKKDPASIPFLAWDLEANDWTRFRVGAWATSEGDVEGFHSQSAIADRLKTMQRRCYAHFGGRYDFFFLPSVQQVVLSGSGILKARHGQASLYDSWFLFQMKLAKIGKAVGLEKYANKSDRVEELSDAELMEHCINDCRVLARALTLHREWCASFKHPSNPRWPPTAGSTAVYVIECLEREHVRYLARELLSIEEWFDMSSAVSGGRVEIHFLGEPEGKVYAYDINSSYPRSWQEAMLPMGPWVPVSEEVPGYPGVYECEVRQHRDFFPVVAPDYRWQYTGRAWCTTEELVALRSARGAARVLRGYVSKSVGPLGQQFVDVMYRKKLAGDPWAKVSINSLHGKLSQGLLQGSYYRLQDGRYAMDKELAFPGWFQRPLIGAFVLARARLRLWRTMEALRLAGWNVYYCDTDCVHTDCPPDRFPGVLSDALGDWKLECVAKRAVYVAPKVYALWKDDEWWAREKVKDPEAKQVKIVCKGFPPKLLSFETLLAASKGEKVPVQSRAGLVAFLSQLNDSEGWGAHVQELERTLVAQTGGKHRGIAGHLNYPDRRHAAHG